jgi:group I intron endonuclease
MHIPKPGYGFIYRAKCMKNGKRYIGKSQFPIDGVKRRHKKNVRYNSDTVFANAIRKYGWKSFKWKILEKNIPIEDLNERESYWVERFHTWIGDPKCHGYNMTTGGDGGKTWDQTGRKLSEKHKENLRNARTGKIFPSDETRLKMSRSHKRNWKNNVDRKEETSLRFRGKPKSEDHKEKIRNALKGRKQTEVEKQNHSEAAKRQWENCSKEVREEFSESVKRAWRNRANKKCSPEHTTNQKESCLRGAHMSRLSFIVGDSLGFNPKGNQFRKAPRCKID